MGTERVRPVRPTIPAAAAAGSAALVVFAALACGGPPPLEADLILKRGAIETGAGAVQALAVREGLVLAAGRNRAIERHRGAKTIVIDLKGRAVVPGFTVPLADPQIIGERLVNEARGGEQYLDLADGESEEDIVQRARARARVAGPGEWILGRNWDETRWVAQHPPDKRLLSDIVAYNPVFLLRKGGGAAWVNKQALDRAGLGGDGLLAGPSIAAVLRRAPPVPPEERQRAILAALDQAAAIGITAVRAIASGPFGVRDPQATEEAVLGAWRALARAGRLPVRVSLLLPAPGAAAEAIVARGAATQSASGFDLSLLLDPRAAGDAGGWCGRAKAAALACVLDAGDPAVLQAAQAACRSAGLETVEALTPAASAPADRWGEPSRKAGPRALTPGERADFLLLAPAPPGERGPRIESTWVGGREVYRRAG